jgi:hypothetical protein
MGASNSSRSAAMSRQPAGRTRLQLWRRCSANSTPLAFRSMAPQVRPAPGTHLWPFYRPPRGIPAFAEVRLFLSLEPAPCRVSPSEHRVGSSFQPPWRRNGSRNSFEIDLRGPPRTRPSDASSVQALESSEIPILKAFCLVAPSVRFSLLAITEAGLFRVALLTF